MSPHGILANIALWLSSERLREQTAMKVAIARTAMRGFAVLSAPAIALLVAFPDAEEQYIGSAFLLCLAYPAAMFGAFVRSREPAPPAEPYLNVRRVLVRSTVQAGPLFATLLFGFLVLGLATGR